MAGPPRRADAARNAEALLAAARALFAERGPDVPFDEVARRAGVGNATLYRHFPTRGDLTAAVYADEVAQLCRRGERATTADAAGPALFAWLEDFVVHVATRRALALAVTEGPDERRSRLFEEWHAAIRATTGALLDRAGAAGAVHPDLTLDDLLALVSGAALAADDADHARRLLALLRDGLASGAARSPSAGRTAGS